MDVNLSTSSFPLPLAAWISVSDEDAPDFLQSQFSNDLRVSAGQCVYGLWLDHRGKIQGDGLVFPLEDGSFRVFSHATKANDLISKLDAHIIADEVSLEDRTGGTMAVGLVGEGAPQMLEASGWQLPVPGAFARMGDCFLCALRPETLAGWMLIGPRDCLEATLQALPGSVQPVGPESWHTARMEAKMPLIPTEIGPDETPNDVGLESACSWSKGCYLGQEVVARQHRLARANRSLVRVSVANGPLPEQLPADLLLDDLKVGSLRALASTDGKSHGLALLKTKILEGKNTVEMSVEPFHTKVLYHE